MIQPEASRGLHACFVIRHVYNQLIINHARSSFLPRSRPRRSAKSAVRPFIDKDGVHYVRGTRHVTNIPRHRSACLAVIRVISIISREIMRRRFHVRSGLRTMMSDYDFSSRARSVASFPQINSLAVPKAERRKNSSRTVRDDCVFELERVSEVQRCNL